MNTKATFEFEYNYHVYNRTNNKERLFKQEMNQEYFVELLSKRISPYSHILACALLGNHFHLAIQVKNEDAIISYLEHLKNNEMTRTELDFLRSDSDKRSIHNLISKQFSRVFNSYSQAINKKYSRSGNLFHKPFKRSLVTSDHRLQYLVYYIHHNSRKHGLVEDFKNDPWHTYEYISARALSPGRDGGDIWENLIDHQKCIEVFGSLNEFVDFHNGKYLETDFTEVWIE